MKPYRAIAVDDLQSLQSDVAEIKRLLLAPNAKFIELAIRMTTLENKLDLLCKPKTFDDIIKAKAELRAELRADDIIK